jgi:hypothetical protein
MLRVRERRVLCLTNAKDRPEGGERRGDKRNSVKPSPSQVSSGYDHAPIWSPAR